MENHGLKFAISTGHEAATRVACNILECGGNAIDAGIAACIALTVVKSEQVQFGGVAPMLLHLSATNRTLVLDGVGRWPGACDPSYFETRFRGRMPRGILRSVVPAAPCAWITALQHFGTMGFAELASPARMLAENGIEASEDLAACSTQFARAYARHPENAAIWLSQGKPISAGDHFRQPNLAKTLTALIDADIAGYASGNRMTGLRAARDVFYKGEIAHEMIKHVENFGGWISYEDLAAHASIITETCSAEVAGGRFHTCGPWSQGPALSQTLQIIEQLFDRKMAADETGFLHIVLEALKLAFADREAFYGDPDFVDCPIEKLLSHDFAKSRAILVDPARATPALPPPGKLPGGNGNSKISNRKNSPNTRRFATPDTSYVLVKDPQGNLFASTPSDCSHDAPAVPGLGFVISTRGGQSRTDCTHPTSLAPGKRPRISACPFAYRSAVGNWIIGGGPGADLQLQAAALVLSRHLFQGRTLRQALAAPRVFTLSPPGSSAPHLCFPGRISAEETLEEEIYNSLERRGHRMVRSSSEGIARPSVGVIESHGGRYVSAPVDPRRPGATIFGRLQAERGINDN